MKSGNQGGLPPDSSDKAAGSDKAGGDKARSRAGAGAPAGSTDESIGRPAGVARGAVPTERRAGGPIGDPARVLACESAEAAAGRAVEARDAAGLREKVVPQIIGSGRGLPRGNAASKRAQSAAVKCSAPAPAFSLA